MVSGFTMGASNRLTFTSTMTKTVECKAHFSETSASSNIIILHRLAMNGVADDNASIRHTISRKIGTGSDLGAASISRVFTMVVGDYVELWIANNDGTGNITINAMQLACFGL